MVGIISAGAYVPQSRLQRGIVANAHAWFAPGLKALGRGERAMANWDEDAITMGVEAGRDCLEGIERERVARVVLASSSHPFLDRQNAGVVKEALNLGDAVDALDVGGSQRAGTSALLDSLYAARGGAGDTLCVAADARRTQPGSESELLFGDAAAALLVGDDDHLAAEFLAGYTITTDFVDHFRAQGQTFDYAWEARWVRDEGYATIAPKAVAGALAKAGLRADQVDRFLMGAPMRGLAALVAKASGIGPEKVADPLELKMGDAGVAHPLILLAHALAIAKAGDVVVVAAFGQGCDALVLRATGLCSGGLGVAGWLARRRAETNYLKYLAFRGHLDVERGMRAEFDQKTALTALYRNRKAVLGLVGGKCSKTGVVQFPKSQISVSQDERAVGTQEDYPLAERRARVLTHTADRLTYSPDPPAYYGVIDFEQGGRMTVEFTDVVEPSDVEVGAVVRMMFRIKAVDETRGFIKYFWKAAPDYRPINTLAMAAR